MSDPYANIYGPQDQTAGAYQGTDGRWYDANGNPIAMPQSSPSAPGGAMLTNPSVTGTAPRPPGWVGPWPPPQVGGPAGDYTGVGDGWTSAPGDPYSQTWTGSGPNPNYVIGSPEQKAAAGAGSTEGGDAGGPDTTKGPLAPFSEAAPQLGQEPAFSFGDFKAPSIADALASPGLQFRMQMGTDALNRAAAARGTLNDSGTLKSMIDYGQNVGEQGYADAFNRDFQGWNANRDLAAQTYGMNRTSQFLDPYQAAFSAWRARAGDYLQNQGTVANTAINWANL